MLFGNIGNIIRVNLSDCTIKTERLSEDYYKTYIGGSGLAARLAYDEIPPTCDPLGPDNKLFFMAGPMVGTNVPSCGRYVVCGKSPLGHWGEANSGGFWGPALKFAGYDGIIVEGMSEKPVYLSIGEDLEIKDASHLWGLTASETEAKIKSEIKAKKVRICEIGPAGEKQARLAAIMNDTGRAAARTGLGAVMGSKKLKAIAVWGKKKFGIADKTRLNRIITKLMEASSDKTNIFSSMSSGLTKYGTPFLMDMFGPTGDIPLKNWEGEENWPGFTKIGGTAMLKSILVKNTACYGCPIGCGRHVRLESSIDPKYNFEGAGPEYETLAAFGSMTLTDNLEAIAIANNLCNEYGMDTISTGSVIAWAIEAFEKGLITKEDTGGIELKWGDPQTIIKLTELIAKREGIGKLLSQGVAIASEEIGGKDFAIQVKGLELPMHDPRAFHGQSIAYATSPRGAVHVDGGSMFVSSGLIMPDIGITYRPGRFETKDKGFITMQTQNVIQIINSSIICVFLSLALSATTVSQLLSAVTGENYSVTDLLTIGERIWTIKRAFNIRCGLTAKDDQIPPRLLKPAIKPHGTKNIEFEKMLQDYYKVREWDTTGKPTPKLLDRLNLPKIKKDLYPS